MKSRALLLLRKLLFCVCSPTKAMGRTLPSMTQVFYQEQESFARFRRSLRRTDQLALDDLFVAARKHLSSSAYASHPLPFETFLLAMLLEEHKETQRLRQEVAELRDALPAGNALLPHPCPSPKGRGDRLPSPLGGRAGDEGEVPAEEDLADG